MANRVAKNLQIPCTALHQSIAAYAREMAGTENDLDTGLESASVEHLLSFGKKTRKRSAHDSRLRITAPAARPVRAEPVEA